MAAALSGVRGGDRARQEGAGQGGAGRGRAGTHLASVCGGVVQCRQPPPLSLPPSLTSTKLQVWQPSKMVLSNIHKNNNNNNNDNTDNNVKTGKNTTNASGRCF